MSSERSVAYPRLPVVFPVVTLRQTTFFFEKRTGLCSSLNIQPFRWLGWRS